MCAFSLFPNSYFRSHFISRFFQDCARMARKSLARHRHLDPHSLPFQILFYLFGNLQKYFSYSPFSYANASAGAVSLSLTPTLLPLTACPPAAPASAVAATAAAAAAAAATPAAANSRAARF